MIAQLFGEHGYKLTLFCVDHSTGWDQVAEGKIYMRAAG